MPGPPLILRSGLKTTCVVLQVVPIPGVGAIIAGARNPHSRLLGRGISQAVLVVFGSWPLIIPGAIGLVWAIWDATRIAKAVPPPEWSEPTPDADPETLVVDEKQAARQARRAQKQAERARRKAEREAAREGGEEDDTRWMP